MVKRIFIIVFLFFFSVRFGDAKYTVTDYEKKVLLTLHNNARAEVGSPKLSWDDKIASVAQTWADTLAKKDFFEHSSSKARSGRGENLYMISGSDSLKLTSDGTDAVLSWIDESYDYDLSTFTCTEGRVCGHYTQLIWNTTKKVGCGKSIRKSGGFTKIYWVCQYDPPGNVVGRNPF